MTIDHMELRLAAARDLPKQIINTVHLIAVLDELDALRAASQSKRKTAAKKAAAAPAGMLPAWLPLEPWEAFLAMRVKIKKPATEYAQKLIIKKLQRFMQDGMPPADVLEQSILNGWQDVFELKNQARAAAPQQGGSWPFPASSQGRMPRAVQQQQANEEALARLAGIPPFDPNTIDMV